MRSLGGVSPPVGSPLRRTATSLALLVLGLAAAATPDAIAWGVELTSARLCESGGCPPEDAAPEPPLHCAAFGPYVAGYNPDIGPHPPPALIDELLDNLAQETPFPCIMTYGVLNGLDYTFQAAAARGIKVIAIIWLDADSRVNDASIAAGINAALTFPDTIVRLSCGSEVRTRHGSSLDAVIVSCINRVRAAGITQPVTTIDTWWEWCDRPLARGECRQSSLAPLVDWIGVNVFPWWENKFSGIYPCTTAAQAADFHIARVQDVRNGYPGKEVILTEFGWPAGPDRYSEVNRFTGQRCGIASQANQEEVIRGTLAKLKELAWSGVAFEAYREPFKSRTGEGAVGGFWGICEGVPPYRCLLGPRMVLGHGRLVFSAVNSASRTDSTTTAAQEVVVHASGGGSFTWFASVTDPVTCGFVQLSPISGQNGSELSVSIRPQAYPEDQELVCTVSVESDEAVNSPQRLEVRVKTHRPDGTRPPIGWIDEPAQDAVVQGPLGVTGWAIDDIEIRKEVPAGDPCGGGVNVWRDPVPGEAFNPVTGLVCIGSATFVPGARPDVERVFPDFPVSYSAGWGMQILTNLFPNGGNGQFRLHVFLIDREGNRIGIGTRSVTCTNRSLARPFGTLDTPSQGGVAAGGPYQNWGWALTPLPATIPRDGSTMWVFVDGVSLGHPVYNLYRPDVAAAFPGLNNSNGAVGYFNIDTSSLDPTTLHSIAWSVTDDMGRIEGIGSRLFRVRQSLSSSASVASSPGMLASKLPASAPPGGNLGRLSSSLADAALASSVEVRRGYDLSAAFEKAALNPAGHAVVTLARFDRIELKLGPASNTVGDDAVRYEGYLVANGELRMLPASSHLDARTGAFAWLTHEALRGSYDLVFVRSGTSGRQRIPVRVTVPSTYTPSETGWFTGTVGHCCVASPSNGGPSPASPSRCGLGGSTAPRSRPRKIWVGYPAEWAVPVGCARVSGPAHLRAPQPVPGFR